MEDNKLIDKNIGLLSSFNFSFNYEKERELFICTPASAYG